MGARAPTQGGWEIVRRGEDILLRTSASTISPHLLIQEIERTFPLADVDVKALVSALASGAWTRVGRAPPAFSVPCLRISSDRLSCTLSLPAGWEDPHAVFELCSKEGIVFGIRLPAVREALRRSASGDEVVDYPIAFGTPPEAGGDGMLRLTHELPDDRQFAEKKGVIDAYELTSIVPVEVGEVLGERIPPPLGRSGRSVTGETIAAPLGRPAFPVLGAGVALEGDFLVAARAGCFVRRGGALSVEPLAVMDGDFGGEFRGTDGEHLLVRGHLRDGADVETWGDVEVQGSIGRAHVTSVSGNVTAAWGILGRGGAVVRAAQEVRAGFVDEAIIEARALLVNEYLSRSIVHVRDGVKIASRRGLIAASSIKADAHVHANSIRAMSPRDTRIDIAGVPRLSLLIEYRILPHQIQSLKRELADLSERIRQGAERKELRELLLAHADTAARLSESQARILELHDLLRSTKGDATFSLRGQATAGFDLTMKGITTHFEKGCSSLLLFVDSYSRHFVVQGQPA